MLIFLFKEQKMLSRKGFTLIELMVVILIVAILAAVAIPILRGRIDAAKWSEGKAGAGTVSVGLRAYIAEGRDPNGLQYPSEIGFADGDLEGTYFTDESYSFVVTDSANWVITVDPTAGTPRDGYPTTPASMVLTVTDGAAAWSPN
jgi:type IV pilus assembly protein PilA